MRTREAKFVVPGTHSPRQHEQHANEHVVPELWTTGVGSLILVPLVRGVRDACAEASEEGRPERPGTML